MASWALRYFLVAVVEIQVCADDASEHLLFRRDIFLRLPLILVINPYREYPEQQKEYVEKKTPEIFTGIILHLLLRLLFLRFCP